MKIDEEKEKIIQQKYAELYQLDMNMRQLQQQIEAINQQSLELEAVTQSLDELKSVEKGSETNCMLTPGIFVKAKILDTEKVLLNVGGGTIVEKTIEQAKEILQSQSLELKALQDELTKKLDDFADKAKKLQEEFQKL